MGDLSVKHLGRTVDNTIRGILTLVSNNIIKHYHIKKKLLQYTISLFASSVLRRSKVKRRICHGCNISSLYFFLKHFLWDKANLFYIRSSSASRTSMLITNFIMVPILKKWFVWRPFIICDKIFLNAPFFLYWAQTKHIVLNETVFFYIDHIFPRRTFNRLIKLIMPTAYPLSQSPYISLSRFYIPFIARSKQEWK